MKEFRFYSWFYVCIECLQTVVFSSRLLSSSTKNQRVGAKQVRVPIALTFTMLFFFPNISPRGCFLKIIQVFQLTLSRVFIPLQNDAHINIWQLNSLTEVKQRSFQGKLYMTIELCFTSASVSTFNIMKEKTGDKACSYAKIKSSILPVLSNSTNQLEYKTHTLECSTLFWPLR